VVIIFVLAVFFKCLIILLVWSLLLFDVHYVGEKSILYIIRLLRKKKNDQNHKDLFLRLQEYNQRFSNEPRTIFQMIRDTPTLLRRLWRDMTHGRLLFIIRNVRFLLLFMAIIFYILSPLDIVPEGVIGMVGLLDDILVVSMLLVLMANVYRSTHIH